MSKKIKLLCAESDKAALAGLTEALGQKGVRLTEGPAGKNDTVLAVLSAALYADREKCGALLGLVAAGAENVLPLKLDEADVPEALLNAIYSRNIIPAQGRDSSQIAERIAAAIPEKKSRLPLWLTIGGAAVLAVAGLLIYKNTRPVPQPEPEAVPVIAQPVEYDFFIPNGWTEEELKKIVCVIIVGDRMELYTMKDAENTGGMPNWERIANREREDGASHWYDREDGHEYAGRRYEDLRFISLMPNLKELTLANMEAGALPELGGLDYLERLNLMDCVIPDLDWVKGSGVRYLTVFNATGSLTDFSPLTGCEKLKEVTIDLDGCRQADFRGFTPPKLGQLSISGGENLTEPVDLSGLLDCPSLWQLRLGGLSCPDLDFLRSANRLEELCLFGMDRLRDISALGDKTKLKVLEIDNCGSITDFRPVSGCRALERFYVRSYETRLRDASFLSGLTRLNQIHLGNAELADLDFLFDCANGRKISFSVWGSVGDFRGLEAPDAYQWLDLDCDDASLDEITSHLQGCTVQNLSLNGFYEVDLAALPRVTDKLELHECSLTDLVSLPADWAAYSLLLDHCRSLRSLDGLQNQARISYLQIQNCPRLADWSALSGQWFSELKVIGGFMAPPMENIRVSVLRLESVAGVEDLSFLDGMDEEKAVSFELIGLDELHNINDLGRFHGVYLSVSPQLQEQAEDLVRAGNFQEYKIEYPQGGWNNDTESFALLSLDELDTLPPALLRHVDRFTMAGDRLVDPSVCWVNEDWSQQGEHGYPGLSLSYHDGRADVDVGQGFMTDLSLIEPLSGLRELTLYQQPLTTLDGMQSFENLESLKLCFIYTLRDYSPVFACQQLRHLNLESTELASIQGAQNLFALESLSIGGTKVSDIFPLAGLDYSAAMEAGGFSLNLNNCPVEDFSPLAAVPAFDELWINDCDAALWMPAVAAAPIRCLGADNCFMGETMSEDEANALLADFLRAHPDIEELSLAYNILTDLTPLRELSNLRYLRVSGNMEAAIESLGENVPFRLKIDG